LFIPIILIGLVNRKIIFAFLPNACDLPPIKWCPFYRGKISFCKLIILVIKLTLMTHN